MYVYIISGINEVLSLNTPLSCLPDPKYIIELLEGKNLELFILTIISLLSMEPIAQSRNRVHII